MEPKKLYKIGDIVPMYGAYLCVPCGYIQAFEEGEVFMTCEACLAGTPDGPKDYQELEVEFWELIS
jgi:hypothetical protein